MLQEKQVTADSMAHKQIISGLKVVHDSFANGYLSFWPCKFHDKYLPHKSPIHVVKPALIQHYLLIYPNIKGRFLQ